MEELTVEIQNWLGQVVGEMPEAEYGSLQLMFAFYSRDELCEMRDTAVSITERAVFNNEIVRRHLNKI